MTFWEKICSLCSAKGITPSKLAESIGMSRGAVTRWREGSIPSDYNIGRIASFFGVPSSYFVESGTDTKINGNNNQIGNGNSITYLGQMSIEMSETEKALIRLFRELDPIRQAYVITNIDKMTKEDK